jgi:hypothetical protein
MQKEFHMRGLRFLFFSACCLPLAFKADIARCQIGPVLRIDEQRIRFHLLPEPRIELPIVISSGRTIEGDLYVELLDTSGNVQSKLNGTFSASPGTTMKKVDWPAARLPSDSVSTLGWYRLRYTFTPRREFRVEPVRGVVQVARIMTGAFEIRLTASKQAMAGQKYPVRVKVDDPASGRAIAGIAVELALDLGGDEDSAIKRRVVTDAAGWATHAFDLPKTVTEIQGTLTATATRGLFVDEASLDFVFPARFRIVLTTDKPLYQPGQTAHLRVMAFGPDRRALADAQLEFIIESEDGDEHFRGKAKTSRFGVAAADWEIPSRLQLGEYRITAVVSGKLAAGDDSDVDQGNAESRIRISRYELPTFTVRANPDRTYYLPGQDAAIEIKADYLFGKSVQHGKVRVVRQDNRHWDPKEQKWLAEETDAVEGELGPDGKYTARFNLEKDFEGFDENDHASYRDLTLAAYVTDLSTNRTEQRRFRIRVSMEPIHLHLVDTGAHRRSEPGLIYFVASYADGTPASVEGTVHASLPNEKSEQEPWQLPRAKIARFHTNRFGVARVELPKIVEKYLAHRRERNPTYYSGRRIEREDEWDEAKLLFEATDSKGLGGRNTALMILDETRFLRVKTDHSLYHPGEAIAVGLETNPAVREVVLNVSVGSRMLQSTVVHISGGKAEQKLEFNPLMRGEVDISAYAMIGGEESEHPLSGSARIIYPALQELQVGLRMAKTTFKPGATAAADLTVRSPEGSAVESALGVLVFDRAVAERVKADEDFGRGYGHSIHDYLDYDSGGIVAGISYRDILGLEAGKPFPEDLQLVAEILLTSWSSNRWFYGVALEGGESYGREALRVFTASIDSSLTGLRAALKSSYEETSRYPKTFEQLNAILREYKTTLEDVRDPWDVPYRLEFSSRGPADVLELISGGVDKRFHTDDDFAAATFEWPYYRETGKAIDGAALEHQSRTGGYIRDYATLRDEMNRHGIDLDALRDPWGHAYRYEFDAAGAFYRITISSAGPDGIFDSKGKPSYDDVYEWLSSMHYFVSETSSLEHALAEHFAKTGRFPQNDSELKPVLAAAALTPDRLLDPWGHPYRFEFSKGNRYSNRITISTYGEYPNQPKRKTDVIPVTQDLDYLTVMSNGPENKPAHAFPVAEFSRVLAEHGSTDNTTGPGTRGALPAGTGGIAGVVKDMSGAVISNASVTATRGPGQSTTTVTDSSGSYRFNELATGLYQLKYEVPGFQVAIITRVPVQMGSITSVDVTMQVGIVSETVEVNSGGLLSITTESGVIASKARIQTTGAATPPAKLPFTPRLRKYFPETLLWRPEVITDKRGRAHIEWPMADNITAWSLSVVASTEAGQVGVAQKELKTFQPFFVEHDPPKILTQGDRISLPVVLRNYTGRTQTLQTELKPEAWFETLSPALLPVTVASNSDAPAVFTFRADSMVRSGKQRVTASNTETGDAMEKVVRVHPDGQELSFATGRLLAGDERSLEVQIPHEAIRGSAEAELRVYPNLIAHVLDAMHGIAQRPTGCAEQITSIAYVSMQALQILKRRGQDNPFDPANPHAAMAMAARKSVQDAHDMLRAFQKPDGGFNYWQRDTDSSVPLTAYVMRFLTGAADFIAVDPKVIESAFAYVISQQQKSGAWQKYDWRVKGNADDANLAAYVTRSLAAAYAGIKHDELRRRADAAIDAALNFLDERIASWSDPYLVGNYAIAAVTLGRGKHSASAAELLARLAHNEGFATYWNLEANTSPFYGWGYTGRLETTALAVEALAKLHKTNPNQAAREQISRGLQYLLAHKDRYCAWYSTHATQNAIEALIEAMPEGSDTHADVEASVLLNGSKVATLQMPKSNEVTGPKVVGIDRLEAGTNKVELVRSGNSAAVNALLVTSYYVPWQDSHATPEQNIKPGESRGLRLSVKYDAIEPAMDEPVKCHVEAERIGFQGYGMMLAEVGLPPGAEVDRESMERAYNADGVDGYEIQPDRVVFYLRPRAGGSRFDFTFKMRYQVEAMTAPSVLYDYYNPEEQSVVTPVKFIVH